MSDETNNNGLVTPQRTPRNKFKAPNNDRPKPIFSAEPTSFSTKKVRNKKVRTCSYRIKGTQINTYPEICIIIILFLNQ